MGIFRGGGSPASTGVCTARGSLSTTLGKPCREHGCGYVTQAWLCRDRSIWRAGFLRPRHTSRHGARLASSADLSASAEGPPKTPPLLAERRRLLNQCSFDAFSPP